MHKEEYREEFNLSPLVNRAEKVSNLFASVADGQYLSIVTPAVLRFTNNLDPTTMIKGLAIATKGLGVAVKGVSVACAMNASVDTAQNVMDDCLNGNYGDGAKSAFIGTVKIAGGSLPALVAKTPSNLSVLIPDS